MHILFIMLIMVFFIIIISISDSRVYVDVQLINAWTFYLTTSLVVAEWL